jgi:glycosyltransferase involved in cell wall biosynthesis
VSRAAIVHDFFVQDGGAERCAVELSRLLPASAVHTTFFDADRFGDRIDPARVRTWPLQRVLGATPRFRALLPLYPAWFTARRIPAELVVSSSVAFAKAVRRPRGGLHVSYVYTPMRYAWDLDRYLEGSSFSRSSRAGARALRAPLRAWDRASARRPDVLVAISETVRERIARLWGRPSELIHPPVDVEDLPLSETDDGFLLVAARLLAYRRIDLAVAAATALRRELVVVGDGPERARLEAMGGPSVRFLGHLGRGDLVELFRRCHAYLLPGIEDFGIAPVEAMACGKPVVAFRSGGATETVIEGRTGTFFDRPDPMALAQAIETVDGLRVDPSALRDHARRFDVSVFRRRWVDLLDGLGVDRSLYSRP